MNAHTVTVTPSLLETEPLIIQEIPPLGADGFNCDLRGGRRMLGETFRRKIISTDARGDRPVVVEDARGNVSLRYRDGTSRGRTSWDDIVKLDSTPKNYGKVTLRSLPVGYPFLAVDSVFRRLALDPDKGKILVLDEKTQGLSWEDASLMVRPLVTGESLSIVINAWSPTTGG